MAVTASNPGPRPAALSFLTRLRPDNFTIALVVVVALATFLPATGEAKPVLGVATKLAIALLFFLWSKVVIFERPAAKPNHNERFKLGR